MNTRCGYARKSLTEKCAHCSSLSEAAMRWKQFKYLLMEKIEKESIEYTYTAVLPSIHKDSNCVFCKSNKN